MPSTRKVVVAMWALLGALAASSLSPAGMRMYDGAISQGPREGVAAQLPLLKDSCRVS